LQKKKKKQEMAHFVSHVPTSCLVHGQIEQHSSLWQIMYCIISFVKGQSPKKKPMLIVRLPSNRLFPQICQVQL
jgi:hypothetical protein